MATQVIPTISIVSEVLGDDNFPKWSACLRNYLLAQDLLDVVAGADTERPTQRKKQKDWEKRNAAALHAIQVSCGPEAFSMIAGVTRAKVAWCTLEEKYAPKSPAGPLPQEAQRDLPPPGSDDDRDVNRELASHMPKLQRYVSSGNWEATQHFLDRHPQAVRTLISGHAGTALHVAVRTGHVKIVKELVSRMSEKDIEIKDFFRCTAFHSAVALGNMEMVECMVSKLKGRCISDIFPLSLACEFGLTGMASYLYSLTPPPLLHQSESAIRVLKSCIGGRIFDIALNLISRHKPFADGEAASDEILLTCCEILEFLSKCPGLFPSGCRLPLIWQRWIYSWIKIQPFVPYPPSVHVNTAYEPESKPSRVMQKVLSIAPRLVEVLLEFLGVKQIYKLKYNHVRLLELVDYLFPYIGQYFSMLQLKSPNLRGDQDLYITAVKERSPNVIIDQILMNAIKFGIVEVVMLIINFFPDLRLTCRDENGRGIFGSSIKYRQEKVFGYIMPLIFQARDAIRLIANPMTGETVLHLAGQLSPSPKLSSISGAALQMQRELQCFNKVESLVLREHRDIPNEDDETAREIFTREHNELRAAGEAWMTSKATSSTVVGALIITIMFTAAFTVPGGTDPSIGLPFFRKNKWFKVFIISDAISLFASATSVLMFLGILTSRYAEQDFIKSLPTKLIIGISTLLLSIAAIMVAFCASLIIMLEGQLLVLIPIVSLAVVPVITFMLTQFPLLLDVYKSTYGSSVFEFKEESYKLINKLIEKRAKAQVEEELGLGKSI